MRPRLPSRSRVLLLLCGVCHSMVLVAGSAAVSSSIAPAQAADTGVSEHNVVVIVADDLGVDLVGAYENVYAGHPVEDYSNTTPALDYLAARGLMFTAAWTAPQCSPSRAQLLTGQNALHHGVGHAVSAEYPLGLQPTLITLPALLREAPIPYHTAATGKWHLADADAVPDDIVFEDERPMLATDRQAIARGHSPSRLHAVNFAVRQ